MNVAGNADASRESAVDCKKSLSSLYTLENWMAVVKNVTCSNARDASTLVRSGSKTCMQRHMGLQEQCARKPHSSSILPNRWKSHDS